MLQSHHLQAIARGDLDELHQGLSQLKILAANGLVSGYSVFDALLTLGKHYLEFGYCSDARQCFEEAQALEPNDVRPVLNLANIHTQQGEHSKAQGLYQELISHHSDHPVVRRGLILTNEYDLNSTAQSRNLAISEWGKWVNSALGSVNANRPTLRQVPKSIGYISADLCQHTVGLLFRGVIAHHDLDKFSVVCYYSGNIYDWVTAEIASRVVFRNVSKLSNAELASIIREDSIDILVDLSGHTAGSRVEIMALRPAPVQLSWLGYFSSVGLSTLDAVLMDDYHCTDLIEEQFIEPIVKLGSGRLPFVPVPWTPDVSDPPCITNGYITYGSFNNTAKYNKDVFELWAKILKRNPTSKLVLKWRTFQDPLFSDRIYTTFYSLGVLPHQIELRGMSFHVDVLKQYADIDIALDPFPFSGGLTSLEALNQGVPVITLPKMDRAVSRQTSAFYHLMGFSDYIANSETDYVLKAEQLGYDKQNLRTQRHALRKRLSEAPFCKLGQYTRNLEATYINIFESARDHESGYVSYPST